MKRGVRTGVVVTVMVAAGFVWWSGRDEDRAVPAGETLRVHGPDPAADPDAPSGEAVRTVPFQAPPEEERRILWLHLLALSNLRSNRLPFAAASSRPAWAVISPAKMASRVSYMMSRI